jgi:cytidyltransferase-like protein
MSSAHAVLVTGGFDDIRAREVRFLEEVAKLGELTVLVWSDEMLHLQGGQAPKFPLAERLYFLNAVRYVTRVIPVTGVSNPDMLPELEDVQPRIWVDEEADANTVRRSYCQEHGIDYRVMPAAQMSGFPEPSSALSSPGRKKVVATGCYDWFHTGHVRFTEEVSEFGDLYVIVGHDANIRLLKGEGHPLLSQEERRYLVGSIKYVKQALVSSGEGWLDADPEIRSLKPDIYVVNEDGDKGGKREYCEKLGIEYLVLKRDPAPGLKRRSSTELRGF